MKLFLSILMLCSGFLVVSQETRRENIVGRIIVEGSSLEGITVFNTSSGKGTLTDDTGKFMLNVALNDILEIRALIYQNIDVKVNEAILESKKMSVYLIEKMNVLDEVVVPKKELSGNLVTDAQQIKTFNPKLDAFYFEINNDDLYSMGDDPQSQIAHIDKNTQGKTLVNGLNVVNIVDQLLIPLLRSEVKNKKEAGVPEVSAAYVKHYLGSDFLVENFNIPEHRVEEFIEYVEDDNFDFDLLNYGHELELLELLSRKSHTFLNKESNPK